MQNISEQITELQQQAKLVQIDRAWETDRQRIMIHTNYGYQIPTRGTGIGILVACAIFVLLGAVICFAPLGEKHSGMIGVGLFIVLLAIIGIGWGLHFLQLAKNYETAYRFYQARRTKVFKDTPASDSARVGQLVPNISHEPVKENLFTHFDQLQKKEPPQDSDGLDEHERKIFV